MRHQMISDLITHQTGSLSGPSHVSRHVSYWDLYMALVYKEGLPVQLTVKRLPCLLTCCSTQLHSLFKGLVITAQDREENMNVTHFTSHAKVLIPVSNTNIPLTTALWAVCRKSVAKRFHIHDMIIRRLLTVWSLLSHKGKQ